jgi:Reverse transcriptase (RNA-dependent DNA polymerase)
MLSPEMIQNTKESDLPKGRKLVGNRRVIARKANRRYPALTVANGINQIPVKYFQGSHAPVVTYTTFRMLLVLKVCYNLSPCHFDIDKAFLYSLCKKNVRAVFPD